MLGLRLIEGWTWFDALYMTVITLTTIGFGEVHPLSQAGRAFTMVLALGGVIMIFFSTAEVLRAYAMGELKRLWENRLMKQQLDALKDHVIICGFGRVGRLVAQEFAHAKVPFVVIDREEALCAWMNKFTACFGGNAGACSRAVIGGVVYRGKKIPDLDGRYIYGEHVQNTVDSFIVKDGKLSCEASLTDDLKTDGTPLQGITSFGTDKDGEVYITDLAGGNIYRIDPK